MLSYSNKPSITIGRFFTLLFLFLMALFLWTLPTHASTSLQSPDSYVALINTLQAEGLIPHAPPVLTTTEHQLIPRPSDGNGFGYAVAIDGNTAVVAAPTDDELDIDSGAIYIFQYSGLTWVQQAKLVAGEGTADVLVADDQFGFSVAIDGDTIVVGAPFHPVGNPGAAYVFFRTAGVWVEQATLEASDQAGGDQFGYSVDISGDTIAIGAPMNDDGGANSGSAYVFTRSGTAWSEQAKLIASDDAGGDEFGRAVAIETDTILVGAWHDDDGGSNTGSAYVFARSGGVWTQQTKLNATDSVAADTFGSAISLDGDTAVIGKVGDDGPNNSGAAYIFQGAGASWAQQAKLKAADAAGFDQFGVTVSISSDRVVVGSRADDTLAGANAGSAYVFERHAGVWSQQARLNPADAAANDEFGQGAAVSGNIIIVGAPLNDEDNGLDNGATYTFVGSGTTWTSQGKLRGHNLQPGDNFGYSIAIEGDVAVVSLPNDDDRYNSTGAVFVFERINGVWEQTGKLYGTDSDYLDEFGCATAVSGGFIAVGARRATLGIGTGPFTGAVYLFSKSGNNWVQQAKIVTSDAAGGDAFGCGLALRGNTLLATAIQDDDLGSNSGSAYIFRYSGGIWVEETKLTASDGATNDQFGRKAALSEDGTTAVIGVPLKDDGATDTGAVYIFQYDGSIWAQQAKLTANDVLGGDQFGSSIAIANNTLFAGSPFDDNAGNNSGSIYQFSRNGSGWTQVTRLTASDAGANDQFGYSLDVSGNSLIVSSQFDDDAGFNAGAVYLWQPGAGGWAQQLKVIASDGAANDRFGAAVAIAGERMAVGALLKDAVGVDSGAAYIYEFQAANISVYKSDFPDPVTTGTTLTYIITTTNAGPSVASNTILTDTLPASVTFNSATSTQGSCTGSNPVICNLGHLNVGSVVTTTIQVTPNVAGVINNTAVVQSSLFDYNLSNNTSSENTTVTDLPVHVYIAPDVPTCMGNTPCFTGSGNLQQALDGVANNGLVTVLGVNPVAVSTQSGSGGNNNVSIDGNGTLLWTGGAGSLITISAGHVTIDGVTLVCSGGCAGAMGLATSGGGSLTLLNGVVDGFETAVSITSNVILKGNTFTNLTTVFPQSGGSLLAYANNITNFTLGINSSSGSLNARHNWWGSGATAVQVGHNDSFDFRLGAAVTNWGEGALGGASLTTASGTGTGVIISHDRGHTNAPFGKATPADGSSQCSEYYDFFVVNGSGSWTVTVPIDNITGCDGTYNNHKLYAFALTGNGAPDTACTPDPACWNLMTGISTGPIGRTLQVTVDANIFLSGTPIVAGNTNEQDPTAVHLSMLSAQTTRTIWAIPGILCLFLFTAVVWKKQRS